MSQNNISISKEVAAYLKRKPYVQEAIEQEIVGEKGVVAKEVSTYELLLNDHPWLEEKRYVFMFSIPNRKTNITDFESWKSEWSKVLFDYARFAVLHILYIRETSSQKPFSNFTKRELYIKEIAEELISQNQAKWLSKEKKRLRVYWKTLEAWSDDIYKWCYENGKIEPIMI